jgi:hypothetical protein
MFGRQFFGRNLKLESGELETLGLEPPDDFAAEAALDPVGFDHHKRRLLHRRRHLPSPGPNVIKLISSVIYECLW